MSRDICSHDGFEVIWEAKYGHRKCPVCVLESDLESLRKENSEQHQILIGYAKEINQLADLNGMMKDLSPETYAVAILKESEQS